MNNFPTNTTINEIKVSGIVKEEQYNALIERISGFCGQKGKNYKEWINIYKTKSFLPPPPPTHSTTANILSEDVSVANILSKTKDVELHVYADILNNKLKWKFIKTFGKIIIAKKESPFRANVRTFTFSDICDGNPLAFLELINVDFSYEYIREGIKFITKNGIFIEIYRIRKVLKRATVLNVEDPFLSEDLYEMEAYTFASQENIYNMEKELFIIVDSLANLEIFLSKDL
ncbi:hypothetical protein ABK040_012142 [Willaertia magna]